MFSIFPGRTGSYVAGGSTPVPPTFPPGGSWQGFEIDTAKGLVSGRVAVTEFKYPITDARMMRIFIGDWAVEWTAPQWYVDQAARIPGWKPPMIDLLGPIRIEAA